MVLVVIGERKDQVDMKMCFLDKVTKCRKDSMRNT